MPDVDFPVDLDIFDNPDSDTPLGPSSLITFDGEFLSGGSSGSGSGGTGSSTDSSCGIRTITYVTPDGSEVLLPYSNSATGLFGPPIQMTESPIPQQSGSFLRNVRHGLRDVVVPCYWHAATVEQQLLDLRALMFHLDPLRGAGTLRVDDPDGVQRSLTCRLDNGWDIVEHYTKFLLGVLVFKSDGEPYWRDRSATETIFHANATSSEWFPIFPLVLDASAIFTSFSVVNNGDVHTWPVWTITGPGSSLLLTNLTTGKYLDIDLTLEAGEQLIIDTRPGQKSITDSTGASRFDVMSPLSSLFPFERGDNDIRLEMASVTDESSIAYSYFRQWLSA